MVLSRVTVRCGTLLGYKGVLFNVQKAFISGKTLRGSERERPAPFPYKDKNFSLWYQITDDTQKRFDDNSKIIVIEGPLANGKTALAQKLADEFEMLYMPQVTMDQYYINSYGYDLRQLDSQLPRSVQSFDEKKFCLDPKHENAASFQINKYMLRFAQYIDALAHVYNTGQGVILERSAFSDSVFIDAMYKCGYISKPAYNAYYALRKNTIGELKRPHLVLYLDAPVSRVKENIKKRGVDYEQNSPALNDNFLQAIETGYKQKFLKDVNDHAELLIYDWTEKGDAEVVIEDIERIDFDKYDKYDTKMKDWMVSESEDWTESRRLYTNEKVQLMNYFRVPCLDCPELLVDADDSKILTDVYNSAPGQQYAPGYNSEMGDKDILFKTKENPRKVFGY